MIDTEQARQNMVENQVRTSEVLDMRALDALRSVRREQFVPPKYRSLAFTDMALPIGHGETMLKPITEGRVLQAVAPQAHERVLEIGAGSGFLTACLAHLAESVLSIEQHADLADNARAHLAAAQVRNARVETAEAVHGFQAGEPFDVVVVGAGVHALPERFRAWVKPGGRLFAIIGDSPAMQATLLHRLDETHWQQEVVFETDVPYLKNAEPPRRFVL